MKNKKMMYELIMEEYEVTSYEEADYLLYEYYLMGLVSKEDLEYYYDDNGITMKKMQEFYKHFNEKGEYIND